VTEPDPLEELRRRLHDQLRQADPELADAFVTLAELEAENNERVAAEQQRRSATLAAIHAALARLRPIGSPELVLERATVEACAACGFDRAVLFRVSGSSLIAESVHVDGDPEWAAELLRASRADPVPLDLLLAETEALRRQRPFMIHDAPNHPGVYQPLAAVYKVTSYVGAPIVPGGRVIGFLHADHYVKGRVVDEFDRDALFAFAEGFGFAFERAVLLDRLRAQGDEVRRVLATTEEIIRAHTEAEVQLVRATDVALAWARGGYAGAGPVELSEHLTRREREVLRLLAAGATNGAIAEALIISEGTVKSHVKRILRRLGARNRVEAASIYLSATERAGRE
jgi:DNA-binding CsgD family transcriptional regulator/GAF domain-containing protein